MEQTVLQRPEILAPAGNADMLRAAMRGAALGTLTLMPCAKPSVFVMPAGLRCM